MVDKHRTMVINMHEILKKMNESSILFYKSKEEVLDNVRNRLFGWVVTVSYCYLLVSIFAQTKNNITIQ